MGSRRASLIVVGGNGFVGSAVCAAAVKRNVPVISISRSGRPPNLRGGAGCWSDSVRWEKGDAFDSSSYASHLKEAAAVIVTVGSPPLPFVDFNMQRRLNGESNAIVAKAASDAGVPRLVVVNASMPAWLDRVAGGYAQGKRDAAAAAAEFASHGDTARAAILKPSAIYGTRYAATALGLIPIPLGLVLGPTSALLRVFGGTAAMLRSAAPYLLDGVLLPPVPVGAVAEAAVHHALLTDDEAAAASGGADDGGRVVVEEAEELLRFAGR
jgi:uncharacterized protein YbjT (DUF2867 family)